MDQAYHPSERCETVRVKSVDPDAQGPFIVINKSDFESGRHVLYSDETDESQAGPAAVIRPHAMSNVQLKEFLLAQGIEVPPDVTRGDLLAAVKSHL